MTLVPVSRFDTAGEFDSTVAEAIFQTVMKMDHDEAVGFALLVLGDSLHLDSLVHQTAIAKAFHATALRRIGELTGRLAQAAVSKGLQGEPMEAELAAVEQLAKAFDASSYSSEARARRAREQQRDLHSGRFVVQHERIQHTLTEPAPDVLAAKLGIPPPAGRFTDRQRAEYQAAYHQVAGLIAPYARLPKGEGVLHLVYSDGSEDLQELPVGGERLGTARGPGPGLDPGRKLTAVKVSVVPSPDAPGAAFSTLDALGMPRAGAVASGAFAAGGALNTETLRDEFGPEWNRHDAGDEFNPLSRVFRRLGAGSKLASDTLGGAAPPKLQMALALGQHAGSYGPEAQQVFGPMADRAAYRYRGTERPVDPRLSTAVESLQRDPRYPRPAKREMMIHGAETDAGWSPSGVLAYFRSRLPRSELNTLQRRSGAIPPSEGVVFDRNGRPVTQAVGYGDDHYLPFNLRHLSKLRGGEYVRTRTFGGPTTEDVYTGLMTGARALTVVSHNGTYTMEFDPSFKGGRRYNDKAGRMVSRYGQLLDAVRNGQVSAPIDPSRMAELATAADREFPEDRQPEEYQAELTRLVARERKNPRLSAQQAGSAAAEFFSQQAERSTTPDGHVMTAPELAASWALTQSSADYLRYREDYGRMARARQDYVDRHPGETPPPLPRELTRDDFATRVLDELRDPDPVVAAGKLADAMGLRRQFDAHMRRADEQNRAALRPLTLNGEGYRVALDALQEQFPYYISRVDFHPWGEGSPQDTGYVAPRHLRPHEVLAGYFDPLVGQGKVLASTIRGQAGRLVPIPAERRPRSGDTPAPRPDRPPAAAGAIAPEVAEQLKLQAARELTAEIRRHPTFSPHVIGTDEQRAIANQPVSDWLASLGGKPALKHLLETDGDALDRELQANPAGYHATLQRAVREVRDNNLFDLDDSLVRAHANGGLPDPVKDLTDPAAALNDAPGTEYRFPGAVYSRGDHLPADVEQEYASDPRIQELIDSKDLPNTLAGGAAFKEDATALRQKLRADYAARLRWQATAGYRGPEPVKEHELRRRAEGLLRAEQLRRRYIEAQQRATVVQTAPAATTEVHWHVPAGFDVGALPGVNSDGGTFRDRDGIPYTGD
jgi:hypothetical protein